MGGRTLIDSPVRMRRWVNPALLAVIAGALLAGLFLVYQTVEAERVEREQVAATADVIQELRNVSSAALNAETGQRGYLITLDRRYLEPYLLGREQFRPTLERLREALGSDMTARQGELLGQIEDLTELKFAEMAETVDLLERGDLLGARQRVLTDEGQEAMNRLRRAIREMETIEEEILRDASTETARAEGRVLPLLGLMLVLVLVAIGFGSRLLARTARAEAEAAQAAALSEARDRADLLARELNHRVKNLFAVILAIVRMSARDAPEAKPTTERIADRIQALLTAHEVTQGTLDKPVASLEALIETTLAPYRSKKSPAELSGPAVMLPAKQVTPLGLVLHELTTNAVKYGCWSKGGTLSVDWTLREGMLAIDWREEAPGGNTPEREGFGSLLMTSAARQLRGTIDRSFTDAGVHVRIEIPHEG